METEPRAKAVLAAILCLSIGALAQSVPSLINYQGRLTDQTGAPLPSGSYTIQFRVWDSPSATNATDLIWAQQQSVIIQSNGVFDAILGSLGGTSVSGVTPAVNDLSYAFTGNNRFLGVTVVSNASGTIANPTEILPRQQLLSVPYALKAADGNPPGTVVAFAGDNCPPGWLPCDGRALSSRLYGRLYTAISTNWGAGIQFGTNDFNLPDLRGYFLRGVDGGAGRDPDVQTRTNSNGLISANVGSLQNDATKKPNSPFSIVGGSHTHYYQTFDWGQNAGYGGTYWNLLRNPYTATTTGTGEHSHVIADGSGDRETRPKNAYVNYIIKY
jgi:hypothetical protein